MPTATGASTGETGGVAGDVIVLESPLDMHVHFRQGDMLRHVAPLTAATFAGALAMPNTEPIVDSPDKASLYRETIRGAARASLGHSDFEVYPTLYFQAHYTKEFLEAARGRIISVKFYPRGMTTNSQHGCDPEDPGVDAVLGHLEELGIPLNIHPEARGYHEDREHLFGRYAREWARRFPGLKIILEHLSDRRSVELLDFPNVYATVTPQHLILTGDDWVGPPLKPHLFCMPVVKRPEDREALAHACFVSHKEKIMLGTDSAPHTEDRKLQCGCAGVFTAPIALQLYAGLFDASGFAHLLQDFASGNARRIYGITPPGREVRLVRRPFVIPERFGDLVPMWAGEQIAWSIE